MQQTVTNTIFAEAYNVEGIEMDEWPMAPLQLESVYEGLIFPALRTVKTIPQLKQAWEKRILHEAAVIAMRKPPQKGLARPSEKTPAEERFLNERRPQLQWMMEMDLFRTGDEKGAALRMLKHIETHIAHKSCAKWITEFTSAVKGQSSEGVAPAETPTGASE